MDCFGCGEGFLKAEVDAEVDGHGVDGALIGDNFAEDLLLDAAVNGVVEVGSILGGQGVEVTPDGGTIAGDESRIPG